MSRAETVRVGVLVATNPVTLARALIAAGVSAGFMEAYRVMVDAPVDTTQLMEDIESYLRYERSKWKRSQQKKPFGFPVPTRRPSRPTLDDPQDHDFEEFWTWLERRRGKKQGFYTPYVKGTI